MCVCICNYWPGDIPVFKLGFLASNAFFSQSFSGDVFGQKNPSSRHPLWPKIPVISQ